jgi:choline kinase
LTETIPKAAVCIASQPLIRYAVNFAKLIGVSQIIVVGGYKSDHVWEAIAGEEIIKLENSDYHKGNLYSLATAGEYMDDDFVQINVDHLYPRCVSHMIKNISEGIWAFSDFDRPLCQDDMKIKISGRTDKKAFITKISKKLHDYDGGYCGITVVSGSTREDYMTSFNNVLCRDREDAVVEDVFVELISNNKPPKVYDMSGTRWLEVDTPEDLANAERILRMRPFIID